MINHIKRALIVPVLSLDLISKNPIKIARLTEVRPLWSPKTLADAYQSSPRIVKGAANDISLEGKPRMYPRKLILK